MVGATNARLLWSMFQIMLFGKMMSRRGKRSYRNFLAKPKQEDLAFVGKLVETGKMTPVIDGSYPLREAAKAMRYFEREHPRGKVVITVP